MQIIAKLALYAALQLFVVCGASTQDAGKKIKGKKRHILVDAQGLLSCCRFG
jgi:hypothetical protein